MRIYYKETLKHCEGASSFFVEDLMSLSDESWVPIAVKTATQVPSQVLKAADVAD